MASNEEFDTRGQLVTRVGGGARARYERAESKVGCDEFTQARRGFGAADNTSIPVHIALLVPTAKIRGGAKK
jgi:hypothetical protein